MLFPYIKKTTVFFLPPHSLFFHTYTNIPILRSEDRWFFYYSRDVDLKKQKEGKLPDMNLPPGIGEKILEYNEADTKLDDIGPSVYVVVGLKRGIKLGLIEKLETPGEKRLYMGHRYKAVGMHIAPCEDKNKERNRNGRCVDRKVWTKVTEKQEYGVTNINKNTIYTV